MALFCSAVWNLVPMGTYLFFLSLAHVHTLTSLRKWCQDLIELHHLLLKYSSLKCGRLYPPPFAPKYTLFGKYFSSCFKLVAVFLIYLKMLEFLLVFVAFHIKYNIYFYLASYHRTPSPPAFQRSSKNMSFLILISFLFCS